MRWEPILEGTLADEARAAVRAAIVELVRDGASPLPAHQRSLPEAVFWAYAAAAFEDVAGIDACSDRAVEQLFARFTTTAQEPALLGGGVGDAWAIAHVSDDAGALGAYDARLVELVASRRSYDLVSGLAGLAIYFLERSAQGSDVARDGLARVLDELERRAEHGRDGVTWFTPPAGLPPWQREVCPDGLYNLGLAHGVPGVVAVLARMTALPALRPRASALASGALAWLLAQRLNGEPRGAFSNWSYAGQPRGTVQTAWCYGDAGVAIAGLGAALALGGDRAPWLALAHAVAARDAGHITIHNAGLCHGTAGLAHLCNRFYQCTREPAFRDAARAWIARTLARREPGQGIAGFVHRKDGHAASADFLDGITGTLLAIMAALGDAEPGWDRALACDLPAIA